MTSFLENRPALGRENMPAAHPEHAAGFQALAPSVLARAAASMPEHDSEAAPQIELIRNGGRIERIIVTCSCCQRIELDCRY